MVMSEQLKVEARKIAREWAKQDATKDGILDVSKLPANYDESEDEVQTPLDPNKKYIFLSIGFEYDLPGCPTGGYSSVRRDKEDNEHAPVEYEPIMERNIYKANGKEYYRVVDRHGNLIGD